MRTRFKGTQADTTVRIRAGQRRRLFRPVEGGTVRRSDPRSSIHLRRAQGTRPGPHVSNGPVEEPLSFSMRLAPAEQQRTLCSEQRGGSDAVDAGRITVEEKRARPPAAS